MLLPLNSVEILRIIHIFLIIANFMLLSKILKILTQSSDLPVYYCIRYFYIPGKEILCGWIPYRHSFTLGILRTRIWMDI